MASADDRPATTGNTPLHSFRCADDVWDRAKQRAESDGIALSVALVAFLRSYGEGDITGMRLN